MGKKKKSVQSPFPSGYTAPTPFNWNSGAGRPTMDVASIMGAAMPLAGTAKAPQYTSPAPPFSGNFWDTAVSPDTMVSELNKLKPDASSPFGANISPLIGTGKTGTPSQGSDKKSKTSGTGINPLMMQMFLKSGMMDKIKNVFSPGGIDPSTMTGGALPFY